MKLNNNTTTETKSDFPVLPEGDYEFEVENAVHQVSSKGNLQWKLQLRVDHEGKEYKVWDYLIEKESWAWKFISFFKAIGLNNADDTDMVKDSLGRIGYCHLVIDPPKDGYSAKNAVKRYVPQKEDRPASKDDKYSPPLEIRDEDLPF